MNLDPMKPLGAFIENTIRPLLAEMQWFFHECERKDIPINADNIKSVINYVARAHFRTVIWSCVQTIVVVLIVCGTWLITATLVS